MWHLHRTGLCVSKHTWVRFMIFGFCYVFALCLENLEMGIHMASHFSSACGLQPHRNMSPWVYVKPSSPLLSIVAIGKSYQRHIMAINAKISIVSSHPSVKRKRILAFPSREINVNVCMRCLPLTGWFSNILSGSSPTLALPHLLDVQRK